MADKIKTGFLILFITGLLISTLHCKKLALLTRNQNALEQYFVENALNHQFVVKFASDSSVDITNKYNGYYFILTNDTSFYCGALTATKNNITYNGTWYSNGDYSKLIINIIKPSIPEEFIFLNRDWRFTKKSESILQLAPWGSDDPKILFMNRL